MITTRSYAEMAVSSKGVAVFLFFCLLSEVSAFQSDGEQQKNEVNRRDGGGRVGDVPIKKVHIIFMNHLDVGYDGNPPEMGFVNLVLNRYFTMYFPQAALLGEQLAGAGYVETFTYTTHPWLVSMYLDCPPHLTLAGNVTLKCPSAKDVAAFKSAVKKGYITWHAGAMNMQSEFMDQSLYEFSLNMSLQLDKQFGIHRKYRVLSQRDVPGMTHSVIPSLVKMNISGVSVGVNPMTAPPGVPSIFRWRYGEKEVLATWHPGGYPNNPGMFPATPGGLSVKDCATAPGFSEALCFAFRTDNSGPPKNVQEVLGYYEILRKEFPGAELGASTLDNFIEALQPIKSQLPVVTKEIADTWIMGISSDPRKTAAYRTVSRVMRGCLATGSCNYDDPRVWNASRFLVKLPEHTWGIANVADTINWSNPAFQKARSGANYKNCTVSWIEQRAFIDLAVSALGKHSVAQQIKDELSKLQTSQPDLRDFKQVTVPGQPQPYSCKSADYPVYLSFSLDGAISTLIYNKVSWVADQGGSFAKFLYISYNETDFSQFARVYNYNGNSAGFNKVNVTKNAHPDSRTWPVTMTAMFQKLGGSCDFWAHLSMVDRAPVKWYGAPHDMWVHYTVPTSGTPGVAIEFSWFDKTSTRLPESLMMAFLPSTQPSFRWYLSKVGQLIDPTNGILNSSHYLHATDDDGMYYINPSLGAGLRISSPDVALTCPITTEVGPMSYAMPLQPITARIRGAAYNIYNNVWDTNYIYWYPYLQEDSNFRARFSVEFISAGSPESSVLKKRLANMAP